jgi:hypothetical protein
MLFAMLEWFVHGDQLSPEETSHSNQVSRPLATLSAILAIIAYLILLTSVTTLYCDALISTLARSVPIAFTRSQHLFSFLLGLRSGASTLLRI